MIRRPQVTVRSEGGADLIDKARRDVGVFAHALVGEPLWPHQLEVARNLARIRAFLSGRQAGKSRTLAILALWEAFRLPGRLVLIVSSTEDNAKDLLGLVSALASNKLLGGSVVDENTAQVTVSNGSVIRSIPASNRQARAKSVDLLILDEACFIPEDVWSAAKYTLIARPGSRVIMASTPYGRRDRFFAVTWRAGDRGEPGFASFRWPSTVSPMVDRELLEMWRKTATDREYRAEVLAEWVDEAGAYYTAAELDAATEDYDLVRPTDANGIFAVAGVDWGFAHDANALVVLAPGDLYETGRWPEEDRYSAWRRRRSSDAVPPRGDDQIVIPWIDERFGEPYSDFIDRVVAACHNEDTAWRLRHGYSGHAAYAFGRVTSEMNGVGQMPSQVLTERMQAAGVGTRVVGVHTDARSKETGFGAIKLALQMGRLRLPRHPRLLQQLAALEYETLDSGTVRIAVPEREGHDDLVMALNLAYSAVVEDDMGPAYSGPVVSSWDDRRLEGSR